MPKTLPADREKVIATVAELIAAGADASDKDIAARGQVPVEIVEQVGADADFAGDVRRHLLLSQSDGSYLHVKAFKALDLTLDKIVEAIPKADAVLAAELSKVAQRVIDARDRRMALQKDRYADLPLINVVLGSDMRVVMSVAEPMAQGQAHIVEVQAQDFVEVVDMGTCSVEAGESETFNCNNVEPLDSGSTD